MSFVATLADKIKDKYAEMVRNLPIDEFNQEMRDLLLTLSKNYGYSNLE
jgi:hypothetical protein